MRFRKTNVILGLALLVGMFLFMYMVIDSSPHGLYGDDEAKKLELKNLETKLKNLETDLAVKNP